MMDLVVVTDTGFSNIDTESSIRRLRCLHLADIMPTGAASLAGQKCSLFQLIPS